MGVRFKYLENQKSLRSKKAKPHKLIGYSKEITVEPGDVFELEDREDIRKMKSAIDIANREVENGSCFVLADVYEVEQVMDETSDDVTDSEGVEDEDFDEDNDEELEEGSHLLELPTKELKKMLRDRGVSVKRSWTKVDMVKALQTADA